MNEAYMKNIFYKGSEFPTGRYLTRTEEQDLKSTLGIVNWTRFLLSGYQKLDGVSTPTNIKVDWYIVMDEEGIFITYPQGFEYELRSPE